MVNVRPLTPVLAKKAADELNENSIDVPYYLNSLREWVIQQPHLNSRTSDQFLITFLRAAKYSLERAKQRLENFYLYKATMPEIFLNRDLTDPKLYAVIKAGCILHLPEPVAPDGPRVAMLCPSRFDLEKYTLYDIFKVGTMATDILLYEDDNAIVAGYIFIMDLANMPKSVLLNFDPNFTRKITIMANKISPTRLKAFHFLNVPTIFEKLFNLVKSVINVKLRKRFYFHDSNLETLYEHVPKHVLPKEYGGTLDLFSLQNSWWQKFIEHREFLKEDESYGVIKENLKYLKHNETLDANETPFGIKGSFRKLSFD